MSFEKAKTLREVHRATNPARPLQSGDPRYVNADKVRGNEDVVEQLFKAIDWSEADECSHQLFTGHRGCGKSTELLRLKARLENQGYAVVYFEGDEDLDVNDVTYTDILLAIARRVTQALGDRLDKKLLDQVLAWFSETLYEEEEWRKVQRTLEGESSLGIGLPEKFPLVARLLAKVTGQIHSGRQVKENIRHKLDPQISQLIENINRLLREASRVLDKPLVIIVDNLDRITLQELDDDRTTHDAIYIEKGEQLCSLDAHMIYTVPISMFYSVRAPVLTAIFPDYVVLPMIKSRTRQGQAAAAGLKVLQMMLSQRIEVGTIFEKEALEYICRMCGGHPRDLMTLVRYAAGRFASGSNTPPINREAAERAVGQLITEYNRTIPEEHYLPLAAVHLDKEIASDAAHRQMLYNQSVLEYYNGPPPWHDVHPVVLELPKFKAALDVLKRERGMR